MIFPVGIEDARVRRIPIFSAVVVVICLVVFAIQVMSAPADGASVDSVYEVWIDGMTSGRTDLALPEDCPVDELIRMELEGIRAEMVALEEHGIDLAAMGYMGGLDTGGAWDPQDRLDEVCASLGSTVQVDPAWKFGLVPTRGLAQPGWVTYIFLHAGVIHLLGNLLFFVLLCGPFVEDVWGSLAFGAFFLVGGVLAGAAQVGLNPGSIQPIIGASGAISACMGAFCVRFAKRRIGFFYFYMLLLRPRWGTFSAPAWLVGAFWLVQDVFYQLTLGDIGGVAYMAHIGGMVFGAGVALVFELTGFESRFGHPLDDSYRIGSESYEERQRSARVLGVPVAALSPPALPELHPTARTLFLKAREAFEQGNARMGTRRLRWLVERGQRPRDDGALRYLVARYSGAIDPEHTTPTVLQELIDVAEDHELRGPSDRLRDLLHPRLGVPEEEPEAPPPVPILPSLEESGPSVELSEDLEDSEELTSSPDEPATDPGGRGDRLVFRPAPAAERTPPPEPARPKARELPGPSALLDIDVDAFIATPVVPPPVSSAPRMAPLPPPPPSAEATPDTELDGELDAVDLARRAATLDPEVRAVYEDEEDSVGDAALGLAGGLMGVEATDPTPLVGPDGVPAQDLSGEFALPGETAEPPEAEEDSRPDLDAFEAALASLQKKVAKDRAASTGPAHSPAPAPELSVEERWRFEQSEQGGRRRLHIPRSWVPRPQEKSLIDIEEEALVLADAFGMQTLRIRDLVAVAVGRVRKTRTGVRDEVLTDLLYKDPERRESISLVRIPFSLIDPEALEAIHARPDFAHMELVRAVLDMGVEGLPEGGSLRAGLFVEYPNEAAMELAFYGREARA